MRRDRSGSTCTARGRWGRPRSCGRAGSEARAVRRRARVRRACTLEEVGPARALVSRAEAAGPRADSSPVLRRALDGHLWNPAVHANGIEVVRRVHVEQHDVAGGALDRGAGREVAAVEARGPSTHLGVLAHVVGDAPHDGEPDGVRREHQRPVMLGERARRRGSVAGTTSSTAKVITTAAMVRAA